MPRRCRALFLAALMLALTGCGGRTLVPVKGTVTVDGQPVTMGRVCFIPDHAKGNTAAVACVGRIGPAGEFVLRTAGVEGSDNGQGAPSGWYKVVVMNKFNSTELDDKIDAIFFDEAKTPLSIEVTTPPPPGGYEIKVHKPAE